MDVTSHFEQSREHLRQVAYRMLGSRAEADDAVQEAWLRLSRSDTSQVANLTGWLTTVVARVCLDMMRRRREVPLEQAPVAACEVTTDPRDEAQLAQTVGLAMLVVLDTLEPPERLAFVLHDLFGVPFDEIADILGRSSEAVRQLASRARRRVRGAPAADEAQLVRRRDTVAAVIAALRAGDVERMVALLDPEVVVRAGGRELRGARTWAESAAAYARATGETHAWLTIALVEGTPAAIVAPYGHLERVLRFTFAPGTDAIIAVDITTDASAVAALDVAAG
jgi:RNA polymerase sigma-70 factor (ECF subfamily)